MKKAVIFIMISVLFSACAKKSPIPEANVSRLEAERSIFMAQSEIDEAEEAGADVAEPKNILEGAKSAFASQNYAKAKSEADRAGEMARKMKQEILAGIRSKEDAQAAIDRARDLIDRANALGGDTSQPDELLGRARTEFDKENYNESVELADQSAQLAQAIIDRLEADTYVVGTWAADRDCLWNIAGKKNIYNDPWKWKRIYRANREKIKDPDIIYPGQKLIIPRN